MVALPETLIADAAALVVIAPHPDDDVLGCGALLAAAAARQLAISVVYVTDGAASHRGSLAYPPERLRAVREREAVRALRRLDVRSQPRFLRCADGGVPAPDDAAARPYIDALRSAIPAGRRALVAVPWRRDPHADHRGVAALAAAALRDHPLATPCEYAVWLGVLGSAADAPLPGEGRSVQIDSRRWLARKRAAIAEHRSQLGRLITDAAWAFELPPALLRAALGPVERFVLPEAPA